MKRLIILRGYPGSGKTTLGQRLAEHKLGTFIDHNQILTFVAQFTGDDEGIYDDIARLEQAMTGKLLGEGKSVIVARGFSSAKSLEPYLKLAIGLAVETIVLRLEVSPDNLVTRVQRPERKQDFNPTVTEAALQAWVATNPLEDYAGEHVIDANVDIDSVFHQVEVLIT